MIIKGIAASLPERRVTNEEVIDLVRHYSAKTFSGDLDHTLKVLLHLLKRSGLIERRWCDRHESPIDHVAIAVREAMQPSDIGPEDVELLIYVGVGRGFLEPGNSHMIANALGFCNAHCFDVVDACMSWVRALHLVDSLFKVGVYKNAVVLNAEFNMVRNGPLFPGNFSLSSADQLAHTFPTYTIGEAATATLLLPQEPENFSFEFLTRPDLSALCTIPLEGSQGFCNSDERIGKNAVLRFTSFGEALHREGHSDAIRVFRKLRNAPDADVILVHSSSKKEWEQFGAETGVADKIHHIFPKTGNLVSASVPTAIDDAVRMGKLNRGDRTVFWLGSAGMSFNATSCIF